MKQKSRRMLFQPYVYDGNYGFMFGPELKGEPGFFDDSDSQALLEEIEPLLSEVDGIDLGVQELDNAVFSENPEATIKEVIELLRGKYKNRLFVLDWKRE